MTFGKVLHWRCIHWDRDCTHIMTRSILCIYLSASIPYRLSFVPSFDVISFSDAAFSALDFLSTLYFSIEIAGMVPRLSRGKSVVPLEEDRLPVVSESKEDYGHRKQEVSWSNFAVSCLATFPCEYVAVILDQKNKNWFLVNRLLRTFYLPGCLSDISSLLEEKGILKNIGLHRTWKLFFAMALAGHWCGCAFFYVARDHALKGSASTWPQDVGLYRLVETAASDAPADVQVEMLTSYPEAYITALYWAYITMITTGFGDIVPINTPETIWCIVSMYLGVVITGMSIANLQLLVTNMDSALTHFQRKMELIHKYMQYRRLPGHLKKPITSFYEYQWDLLRGADEEKILAELPRSLQQQVANFMCRDLIASLPILRKANNALLNALADAAEINIYSPNDDIVKPGQLIRGVLLVSRGEVEILNGGTVERKMQRFDRFAEDSLFAKKPSSCRVRSKGFSEVFLLPADEFQHIIKAQCDSQHVQQMRETALALAKSSKKANKMFGSAEDAVPMSGFRKHCHPNSLFRKFWDLAVLFGLVFYIFAIPLHAMNSVQGTGFRDSSTLLMIGYAVDALFVVDLVLQFNFFMYSEDGLVVFDRARIRHRFYRRRSLRREAIAVLPFDLLALMLGTAFFSNFLRLTKIVRLANIKRYLDSVELVLSEFKVDLDQSVWRVVKLNFLLLVVCHWVGCCWYALGVLSSHVGFEDNWIEADEEDETLAIRHSDMDGFSAYLRSVYWAIVGMSTVGYGDIVPTNIMETTFATFVILFGGLICPAIVGGLAAYMGNLNITAKLHKKKLGRIRGYMRKTNMGKEVVDQVLMYHDYLWSRQGGVDEQAIMDELPGPLRLRVAMFINGSGIDSVPFFSFCDETTKQLIISILKPRVFLPLDVITHQGEMGTEMFLIERGRVVVTSQDRNIPYCTLTKGDYFGETCLLGSTVCVATVSALTYCDCFVLGKDDFHLAMAMLSDSAMQARIIQNVSNTIRSKRRRYGSISMNMNEYPKCIKHTEEKDIKNAGVSQVNNRARYRPDSGFRQRWNALIFLICLYNAWSIPFRLAFIETSNVTTKASYWMLDWVLDLFFILDIILHCCEFAYVHEGELVSDRGKVKRHYLRGKFKTDLVSTIPLDVLVFLALSTTGAENLALIIAALRIPKLLRFGQQLRILEDLFRALADTNMNLAPLRLVEFLSGVILIAHCAACGFYAFARWKNDYSECMNLNDTATALNWGDEVATCRWVDTWIQKQIINGKVPVSGGDLWQLYLRSFNWALPTLVVVVIGDVVPVTSAETLYAFLWMIVGVTINASIIGNVANIVANLETDSADFVKRADEIKRFLFKHHVGQNLKDRVDDFMRYLWTSHSGTTNEEDFIEDLPYTLQLAVAGKTRMRHIKDCPFFDFCSGDIVKALTLCLKPLVFSIGDVLVHAGDMGQEMFFLDMGSVEVFSEDSNTVLATLTSGSFFGETSVFFKQKRITSIRATSFCDVFQLDKCDLDRELRQRDFSIEKMLKVFTDVARSNERRNAALRANMEASNNPRTKLYKLIDAKDGMTMPKRRVRKIFLPNSSFRACWDIVSTVFTIYYAVSIPYRAAFVAEERITNNLPLLAIDFSVDLFFIVDVYFRLSCFAFLRHGMAVTDNDAIRQRYFRNGMILDLVSCAPCEILSLLWGVKYIFFFRLVHLIRCCRFPTYFRQIDNYLNLWDFRISAASSLLAKMFFFYIMVNHWCACIWFAIHRYLERHEQYTWATTDCPSEIAEECLATWDEEDGSHNVCNRDSFSHCYVRAFYFVITTISTVGYGDISPVTELETVFEMIVVLIGACFLAGIIGAFAAILSHSDTTGPDAFKLKLQKLVSYMKYRGIPAQLQEEIKLFHRQSWEKSQMLDERAVLGILPLPLQMDLSFAVKGKVMRTVPILQSLQSTVQKRIAYALTLQMCPANSNVYLVGDVGTGLYFIGSGILEITLPTDLSVLDYEGRKNAEMVKQKFQSTGLLYRAGNHVGESCLTSESGVRQETVTAKTTAQLYLLLKEDFELITSYMASSDKEKLKRHLLNRNGNVWHTFEEDCDHSTVNGDDHEERISVIPQLRLSSIGQKSFWGRQTPQLSMTRSPNRRNMMSAAHRESWRLRSFSAAASEEAIRSSSLSGSSESEHHQLGSRDAAIEIQRLYQMGKLVVHKEEENDDSSSSRSESMEGSESSHRIASRSVLDNG